MATERERPDSRRLLRRIAKRYGNRKPIAAVPIATIIACVVIVIIVGAALVALRTMLSP